MNWEAIGVVAELLSALGVIASLLYLAVQVRSSTQQAKHDAARSVQTKMSAILRSILESPSAAEAYARAVKGWDHLETEGEMMQISAMYLDMIRTYEELIKYREQGQVDEWAWTSVDSIMRSALSSKGFSDWWSIRASWFSTELRAHVDSIRPDIARDIAEEHRSIASEGVGDIGA